MTTDSQPEKALFRRPQPPEAASAEPTSTGSRPDRFSFRLKPMLYGLAALGGVVLVALVFRPAPKAVEGATVVRGDLQVTVAAEGKTRVRDRFVVAAPVEGRLVRIGLKVGDVVQKGGVVAQLDPLPLTSQVQQAQAQLRALQAQMAGVDTLRPKTDALAQVEARIRAAQAQRQAAVAQVAQAEATWQQAQRELQRANDLLAQGAIPRQNQEAAALAATARQREWEAARQGLESAIAEVNAAQSAYTELQKEQQDPDYLLGLYQAQMDGVEAELARLADEANRTQVRAPAAGRVLRVLEESARFVSAGTPLLELGDPGQLELVIDVLSTDAVKIQPGDLIQVQQWGGEQTLVAKVRSIEPAAFTEVSALGVEEQRVNIIGDFADANVPLGDGYQVDTQIVVDQVAEALKVPISAIFPCEAKDCVFVVRERRAQPQPITVGQRNTVAAVVQDGLTAGDVVIAYPETVEAGNRVKVR